MSRRRNQRFGGLGLIGCHEHVPGHDQHAAEVQQEACLDHRERGIGVPVDRHLEGRRDLQIGALAAAAGSALMFFAWEQRVPETLAEPRQEGNALVFNEASEVYLEPGARARFARR